MLRWKLSSESLHHEIPTTALVGVSLIALEVTAMQKARFKLR